MNKGETQTYRPKDKTMHQALHSRDDVERQYVSRKEGGELASNKYCEDK